MYNPIAHMGKLAPLKGVWEPWASDSPLCAGSGAARCLGLACPLAAAVRVVWPRDLSCPRSGWLAVVAGVEVPNLGRPEVLSAAPHLPVAERRLSQPVLLASQRL